MARPKERPQRADCVFFSSLWFTLSLPRTAAALQRLSEHWAVCVLAINEPQLHSAASTCCIALPLRNPGSSRRERQASGPNRAKGTASALGRGAFPPAQLFPCPSGRPTRTIATAAAKRECRHSTPRRHRHSATAPAAWGASAAPHTGRVHAGCRLAAGRVQAGRRGSQFYKAGGAHTHV
jgi:hypothetical protein